MKKFSQDKKQPQTQIRLNTRKSKTISRKILDDFYCFDSSPRFFTPKKLCNSEILLSARSKAYKKGLGASWESILHRTSPNGFGKQNIGKITFSNGKKPETPRFKGIKMVEGSSSGLLFKKKPLKDPTQFINDPNKAKNSINNAKNEYNSVNCNRNTDFLLDKERFGKRCLRLNRNIDELDSLSRTKEIYKSFMGYESFSKIFHQEKNEKPVFSTEYRRNYTPPNKDAYINDLSPFK